MNPRPIIDAGPALNFFAINRERLLFSALGPISTPEAVKKEILRKAATDPRFEAVEMVWTKLPPRLLDVLSDDETPELAAAVARISSLPFAERKQMARDLGETLVVAHAAVKATAGAQVTVIIDDSAGTDLAAAESRRLDRLRAQGRQVGSIILINTVTVLQRSAGGDHLPDAAAMRTIYRAASASTTMAYSPLRGRVCSIRTCGSDRPPSRGSILMMCGHTSETHRIYYRHRHSGSACRY